MTFATSKPRNASPPASESSFGVEISPPAQQSLDGCVGSSEIRLLQDLLASEDTFAGFYARATAGNAPRMAAGQMHTLVFLQAAHYVSPTNIRTVDQLYEVAPNVTSLWIDIPLVPSLSDQRLVPELDFLCIDEGNIVLWSWNRTAATLDALRARDVAELYLRNTTEETVRSCLQYLHRIASAVLVDDGGTRYAHLVDAYRAKHTYAGQGIAHARFLFASETLGNVTSLTVSAWMATGDIEQLFNGFPRGLKNLQVWYGADHHSLPGRSQLLKYRGPGGGRCTALRTLVLSTSRPLNLIQARAGTPPPMPIVRQSDVYGFLTHIHDDSVVDRPGVELVEDGVLVWPW
ncbi:hypothetical protein AURDEDRAFT_113119 [Auricularia subglabra TFB-10046 SS5]|nr:hypothetical protein AURDEDRAFT_113119 [Auricularia subglabra TFB-10046 SS5]